MTTEEEIADLKNKLSDSYSEEAKEIFRVMLSEKQAKLNPQIVIENS